MATIDVLNWKNSKVGQVDLSADIFERPVRKDLLQTVVKWQLAKRRQGTHMTKTKGLVSGGGAKPYKQKGTGNARRGSSRSPLIRGGGVIFGPQPRDYSYTLPKKQRIAALKTALSYLYAEGKLKVVDKFESTGKTKEAAQNLQAIGVKKAVCVGTDKEATFARATRNIPTYLYLTAESMNVYDLLKYDQVVLEKDSVQKIQEKLGAEA
ncbi:MAG: 50S ribosomal protein L4 [Bdellovibrionaceae bacterium]|nr:50S ribosomal protein L4 [Pseudobdellovibrionaceae bacterium]